MLQLIYYHQIVKQKGIKLEEGLHHPALSNQSESSPTPLNIC